MLAANAREYKDISVSLWHTKMNYDTDCVEFCPISLGNDGLIDSRNLFVAGTYQLFKDTGEKKGRLHWFLVQQPDSEGNNVRELETFDGAAAAAVGAAVFDVKWSHQVLPSVTGSSSTLLAHIDSDGQLHLHRVCLGSSNTQPCVMQTISQVSFSNLPESKTTGISLDWNDHVTCGNTTTTTNNNNKSNNVQIVSSYINGSICLWTLNNDGLILSDSWKAHDLEAWTASFNCFDPHLIYTGADDGLMKGWDNRALMKPVFINKSHTAGVCNIQHHPSREYILASGSYDEMLRIWDYRNMSKPLCVKNMGGGVWKLKWMPSSSHNHNDNNHNGDDGDKDDEKKKKKEEQPNQSSSNYDHILTACMHNHFRIVSLENDSELMEQYAFRLHTDIAYGCDWSRIDHNVMVSCSFYDRLIHLWSLKSS